MARWACAVCVLMRGAGGTADRHIRFWNTTTGTCLNAIDTKSQVSALLWNKEHREIISAHGFSNNQLSIWKYPTLSKVTDLNGHSQRVLAMAISPDGTTVLSAAADETLRFWKCFARCVLLSVCVWCDSRRAATRRARARSSLTSARASCRQRFAEQGGADDVTQQRVHAKGESSESSRIILNHLESS